MKFIKILPLALGLFFIGCSAPPKQHLYSEASIDIIKNGEVINTVKESCDLRFNYCTVESFKNQRKVEVGNNTAYFCDLNKKLYIIQSEYKGGSVSHLQDGFKCEFNVKKVLK